MGKIKKTTATVCLSGTLVEKMHACAAAGFDGIELFEPDLVVAPQSPEEIRTLAERLGLDLVLYQPFRDFEGVVDQLLADNLRRAEAKFALMQRLGIDTILVCSNVATATIDDDQLVAGQLRRLGDLAQGYSVRIAYEALAWGRFVSDYRDAWRIVELADHDQVGVCLDSFHILSRGHDPAAIEQIPGEKIFFLQLADAPLMSMDVLQWSRHHRLFPGQGEFDLPLFVDHILTAGYSGPLSLEVFNDIFRQSAPVHTAVDALRSLLVLEESVARTSPANGEKFGLTSPPRVPTLSGHAFVELSAGAGAAAEVADALTSFGFTQAGTHRTGGTQLWQQGDARILLNAAADAAADASEIASLGFDSDGKERLAARAAAFLATPLPGSVSGMSVTAPDSTVLHFCDGGDHPAWMVPYGSVEETGEQAGAATGLTRIDHVALTQPFDYFDEAALFYRAVLGLAPASDTEFAAPFGLVRGRALSDRSGCVRIVLQRTLLRRGEWAPNVPDPQHVAFATEDILTTARALQDRGAPLLTVSDNYYEDLDARFGLDPSLIDAMREFGILYDREKGGEFYHLYTSVQGSRVFFEVVQRVGAYPGYGSANSAVRMTAQRSARAHRSRRAMPAV